MYKLFDIKTKYGIGEIVYLITEENQQKFIITGIIIRTDGVMYELSGGRDISFHSAIEISRQRTNDHLYN